MPAHADLTAAPAGAVTVDAVQAVPLSPRRMLSRVGVAGLAAVAAAAVALGPGIPGDTDPVARFLFAVGVALAVSHLCGVLGTRLLRQPPVVGELAGGLLLGPSLAGALLPQLHDQLFTREVVGSLDMAAQLGLVVFMFLLGSELRLDRLPGRGRVVGLVVAGSITLPFAGGVAVAVIWQSSLIGPGTPPLAFVLFAGLALSITAMPVLARILTDSGLQSSPVGGLALTSAAVGDAIAWLMLTAVLTLTGIGSMSAVLSQIALAAVLLAVTVLVVRPALAAFASRVDSSASTGSGPTTDDKALLPVLVVGALSFAATSQLIGLHPVIGAFVFGMATPRHSAAVARASSQLRGFAVVVLLPLFFVSIGLKSDFGSFGASPSLLLLCAVVLVVATATKFLGATAGARVARLTTRESLQLGAMMNCRGVTELVVISIGLQHGLINGAGFTILVIVALLTTALTVPLIHAFRPHPSPRRVRASGT